MNLPNDVDMGDFGSLATEIFFSPTEINLSQLSDDANNANVGEPNLGGLSELDNSDPPGGQKSEWAHRSF